MKYFYLLFLLTSFSFSQENNVTVQKPSKWVLQPSINHTIVDNENKLEHTSGFYYLHVEKQDNLLKDAYYTRISAKVLNNEGLAQIADIYVDYDPEYSQLFFHHITIIRDGKVIDKLDASLFKTIQREQNIDMNLYDGKYTTLYHISDIRVGDVIDYAYTLKGSNPIFKGKYYTQFYLEYAFPVQDFVYTVYLPKGEDIRIKKFNNASDPVIEKHPNYITYKWHEHTLERIDYENNVPIWYDPAQSIEISQYDSWEEVNQMLLPHYASSVSPELLNKKLEEALQTNAQEDSAYITKTIRFVQNDIRYLGFENGLNSYKPTPPLNVLQRRFGDCKDKSFLLAEILNANGYEARPVLVNSLYGKNIKEHLPSPTVFDHCIVEVKDKKHTYYIDPTITSQGGSINNTYFPDYRTGLPISTGQKSLIKFPSPPKELHNISETYNISNVGKGAYVEVQTDYSGSEADAKRQEFAISNPNSIQKKYTEFYSALYPDIQSEVDVKYKDDVYNNRFSTQEFYKITNLWNSDENTDVIDATFFPLPIEGLFLHNASTNRSMPYALPSHIDIKHQTVLNLPEPWNVEPIHKKIENDYFLFKQDVEYTNNNQISIDYHYKTYRDYVKPEDMGLFLADNKKVRESLGYSLTYNKDILHAKTPGTTPSYQKNLWYGLLPIFIALLSIGITIFICVKIYFNYDIPAKSDLRWETPIGGWLIVILISLFLTPLFTGIQTFSNSIVFSAYTWKALFNPTLGLFYHAVFMALELMVNCSLIIFSIFLIILFFKKRTILPRLLIIFTIINGVIFYINNLVNMYLSQQPMLAYHKQQMYVFFFMVGVKTIVIVLCFLYSECVKDTFVRTRKHQQHL